MEEVERLADRIVVMDHGRVIADDTLAGLQSRVSRSGRRARHARNGVPHAHRKEPARLMALIPFLAMVRKDLQLFFSDRRSVIVSFVVPIAIASFFGSIFSGPSNERRAGQDCRSRSSIRTAAPISKAIVAGAQADTNLKLTTPTEDEAREAVRRGTTTVADRHPARASATLPAGRFSATARSRRSAILFDPSRGVEVAMVRGMLTRHVMEAVSREMFGGAQGRALVDADAAADLERRRCRPIRSARWCDMLGSVQRFYNQPPGARAGAAPAGAVSRCRTPCARRR